MKRFILVLSAVLLCLLLVLLSGYGMSLRLKPELQAAVRTMEPADKVPVGGSLQYRLTVTLPITSPAPELAIEPPRNTVLGGPVQVARGRYRWNRSDWTVTAVLRPVIPGAATGGKAVLAVKGRFPAEETFPIPDFVIEPVQAEGEQLDLADRMPETAVRSRWPYYVLGTGLLLLAVWGVRKLLRKKRELAAAPLPPWISAEHALSTLSDDVAAKRIPLAVAFFRLTDVVRKYIEERYHLPVTSRTTDEFMLELRDDSPLPEADQPFLRDFLASADLVKFARLPPDETQLSHAVKGARELIRHTVPAETEVKHV